MAEQFYFVEALEEAVWRSERQMVLALVEARWRIDTTGVQTMPHVVYSFASEDDATYFLTVHEGERNGQPRAVPVYVRKGDIVTFWRREDAAYFVDKGRARWVSDDELRHLAAVAAAEAQGEGGRDDVPREAAPDPEPVAEPAQPQAAVEGRKKGAKRGSK